MAINPETQYPGKIAPSTPDYPYGAARNITVPGDGTGTPWEAALVNDLFGFQQALLAEGVVIPSGTPEKATNSQYLTALKKLFAPQFDSFSDLRSAADAGALALISRAKTKEYGGGNGAGAAEYIKDGTTGTPSTGDAFKFFDLAGDGWLLQHGGTIFGEQFGVFGNNSGSPYDANFRAFMAASGDDSVVEAILPNRTITFDNSGGAESFRSNCSYLGGKSTFIQPTTFTERVFLTQNESDFSISRVRSYINEGLGGEDDTVGGGYWRFESCTGFKMANFEVSRSFSGGVKFVLCSDFELKSFRTLYNQFSGFELEGCSDYIIKDWKSNNNGRYSSDDSYKPLPTGWTGTHGGRGFNVAANGDTVDQLNSIIADGRAVGNSEYGYRMFTSNTKGVQNLLCRDIYVKDNGHPAGTYGTVVLASDKGVDVLVNSDVTGESFNIENRDIKIYRSLSYGQPISIDGEQHVCDGVVIRLTGAARHVLPGFALFGAKNYIQRNCRTYGASFHTSFGSNDPQDVRFENDKGFDCLVAFNGVPVSGENQIKSSYYKHRDTVAVAGESGTVLTTVRMDIFDTEFDGFYRGIEATASNPVARVTDCVTKNTVDSGFYGNSVTDQSNLEVDMNSFDSAFPGVFATFEYNRRGSFSRKQHISNAAPPFGGANGGLNMNWNVGDRVRNSNAAIGSPIGWLCTVAGTPGTWVAENNL